MIGDWKKATLVTSALKKEMEAARIISLKRWSSKARSIAITHITKQDLNWEALSTEYLKYKVKKGLSNQTLVATSTYKQNINAWNNITTAFAGVKRSVRRSDGTTYSEIARVLEYGNKSNTIPERPLWRPTFKETMAWYVKSSSRPDIVFKARMNKRFGII